MIKKILVTVMALSLFACTSGKLEQLGGGAYLISI